MIGTGIGILKRPQIAPQNARDYRTRVAAGSGSIINDGDMVRLYKFYLAQGTLTNTRILFDANAGMVQRLDGVLRYVRTAFDLSSNANNLDGSATATQQPRLVGGIAPGSKPAASNQNGESRYFTHTPVSFAANEAWSVTVVLNWSGTNLSGDRIIGNGAPQKSAIGIYNANSFTTVFISENVVSGVVWNNTTKDIIGKNSVITLTAHGDGFISLYKNGVLIEKKNSGSDTTAMIFSKILKGTSASIETSYSKILAYRLQSGAMTPAQVAAEAAMLATRHPEMESVVIGSQTWATRNFEAVATHTGNVIVNVTENVAVEKHPDPTFELTGNQAINVIGTYWRTFANTSIVSGKLVYDGLAQGRVDAENSYSITSGKWYKKTVIVSSGIIRNQIAADTGGSIGDVETNAAVGTTITYFKATVTTIGGRINLFNVFGGTSGEIDSITLQELNWSNSTEIYDAVYAATAGTAAEKEYAALKEAAMWCYHSNTTDNGATYGKLYNGYAKALLKLDLATAAFGWHVETEAELNTLAVLGGNALKYAGTNYWTTDGGTNSTSFTALGGANRSGTDGTFSTIKNTAVFGDDTGTKALTISHDSDTATVATVDIRNGNSIRLIKN